MAYPLPQKEYTVMVVTNTYNHQKYIEDALRGIVMQQTDFSVIACVLDDCSTDGTADIIRKYEEQYSDLIKGFYFSENQYSQGKSTFEALNPWLEKVKYIALCEGDDYWIDPLKLQKQVKYMESHPEYSMCFHNSYIHWDNNEKEDCLFYDISDRDYSGEEVYEKWVVPTASILFKESILSDSDIQKRLLTKGLIATDYALVLSCSIKGKLYGMSEVMSVYRKNKMGFSANARKSRRDATIQCIKYVNHYRAMIEAFGKEYREIAERDFYNICFNSFLVNLKKANIGLTYQFFKLSVIYSFLGTLKYFSSKIFSLIFSFFDRKCI